MLQWFLQLILPACILGVSAVHQSFIDSQQCHSLQISEFQALVQNILSGAPVTLVSDKQAFFDYLTTTFVSNEYPDIIITSPGGYINGSASALLLPNLIAEYLSDPDQNTLQQIAIRSILDPGFPIPHPIRDLISADPSILNSASALTSFIDTYLVDPSPLLLPPIANLAQKFPFYIIPNDIMNELVNRGYLDPESASTLTTLIPLALQDPQIQNLQRIIQLANVYSNIPLPPALVRVLIDNNLLDIQQGEVYYRRLLSESVVSPSQVILEQVLEYSSIYRNIVIPDPVISLLLQYGLISTTSGLGSAFNSETILVELIRQALASPSYPILQQIAHLSEIFRQVSMPAVIMRQMIINNLVHISRGEILLNSLILQANDPSADPQILQWALGEIALLLDLFPNYNVPDPILSALGNNNLLQPWGVASENTLRQLIEQQLASSSLDTLKQISHLAMSYPSVALPDTIQRQLELVKLVDQYIVSPNLNLLQDLGNRLQLESSFPIASSLRNEIRQLLEDPSSLTQDQGRLQALILQYLAVPNDFLLDEMAVLVPRLPYFPIPTPIAILLAQRVSNIDLRDSILIILSNKLTEQYLTTYSDIALYQAAELFSRFPHLPIPDPIASALASLLNVSIDPSGTSVTDLLNLINRFYATRSSVILNEIFVVAQLFPNYPIPEYIIFEYLVQQFINTGSIEILRQVSVLMFKYSDVIIPEVLIEALITQNIWTTSSVSTHVILRYLISNHESTQSYVILKFISSLFWLHPDHVLSVQIVEQLVRFGLLKVSKTEYNAATLQEYIVSIYKLIQSYQATRSVSILEQIIEIVQIFPSYPLPTFIWIEYYLIMYERTQSQYYLIEIGRKLYLSWETILPENILSLILQDNLLLGTLDSEIQLITYITTNYASTTSPYILAAIYQLYVKYPQIDLPSNMYILLIRLGLITNTQTQTIVDSIETIIEEFSYLDTLDTSAPVFVVGMVPWRLATFEKLFITQQARLIEVQAIVTSVLSRKFDSALPTYQTLSSLLNGIMYSATFFVQETEVRVTANKEIVIAAQNQPQEFINIFINDFAQNFQIGYSSLGRVSGIFEAVITSYQNGEFNIAALGQIIAELLLLDEQSDSIEQIFDSLVPAITLSENARATVLDQILPVRLESAEKELLINEQRFQQLTVLVVETVKTITSNGYGAQARISQVLNTVLALIRSFISEADSRLTFNRNILIQITSTGFVISDSDLSLFSENLKIAEMNLGRASGAIESVVIAISAGDISFSSITIIIREILRFDQSVSIIESIYDEFASLPLVSSSSIQKTLAQTLPWRIAFSERHFTVVQSRLQDLTVLIQSLVQTSESNLSQALSIILGYITSLTNEAYGRLIANKNIFDIIASNNFVASSQQLAPFDDNERVLLLSLGRASGATEAIVVAFLSGQLSVTQLSSIIQIILDVDTSATTVNSVYNDLSVLSSLAVTSNLQVTLSHILRYLQSQFGINNVAGTLQNSAELTSIMQSLSSAGLISDVSSANNAVGLQIILAVILPARQAVFDRHLISTLQQVDQLKILTANIISTSIDAGPAYANIAFAVEHIEYLLLQLTTISRQKSDENRALITSALQRNFLLSSIEISRFTENSKIIGQSIGRINGIVSAVVSAYNNGNFDINSISYVLKYILQFEDINIDIEQILLEIENIDYKETTRISILSSILPYRIANAEMLVSVHQSRVAEISILITDIIQTTTQIEIKSQLSSILTVLGTLINEASARVLAARNIVNMLINENQKNDLTVFSDNIKVVSTLLGQIGGTIDALIAAYNKGSFTVSSVTVILELLTSFDTTTGTIEDVYNELSVLSSFAVGSNFQTTLSAILSSILDEKVTVTTAGATSAAALRSLLGTINNKMTVVNSEVTSGIDVLGLQTVLAVTMSSVQSTLEKYLSVTQSRLIELRTLAESVILLSADAGPSYKYIATYVEKMISSLTLMIDEAAVKTSESRQILLTASRNSFIISLMDVRVFNDNTRFGFYTLGRAAGIIEAFVNAYNVGEFRLSTVRFILQSLLQYDESVSTIEITYAGLDTLFALNDVSKQVILSQVLPWLHAYGAMKTRLYTNRLAELEILIAGIEKSSVQPNLWNLVQSIRSYVTSIVTEVSARQLADQNILNFAASRQYAVTIQDVLPFYENHRVIATTLGRAEGAIDALIAAYTEGQFSVSSVTTIIQGLIGNDLTITNVEKVYDELSLLSSLSVMQSTRLSTTLQSILKNYLKTNYVEYTGTLNEAIALQSLAASLSNSLQQGSTAISVATVTDVVAIQTILSVTMPAMQALADKNLLITEMRLQEVTILIKDWINQAVDAGASYQVLTVLMDQLLATISYNVAEVQVRVKDNRVLVTQSAQKAFLITNTEIQIFEQNLRAISQQLGKVAGTIDALALAYKSGQLSIKKIVNTIQSLINTELTISTIEAIYDELTSIVVVNDQSTRPVVLAKILPWRLANINLHVQVNVERLNALQVLIDDTIIQNSNPTVTSLLRSLLNLIDTFLKQAQANALAVKNYIDSVKNNNWEANNEELLAMAKMVQKISQSLGQALGTSEAIVVAYLAGEFSVTTVSNIIQQFFQFDTSISSVEILYEELASLVTLTPGSSMQATLTNILALHTTSVTAPFGSTADALALRSVLINIDAAFTEQYIKTGVTSVNDVVALQTVLAVLLPARMALLDKYIMVHMERVDKMDVMVDEIIVQILESDLPSHDTIVSLLRGIKTIVRYFIKKAQTEAVEIRDILTLAISRRFLITRAQLQTFNAVFISAFDALGRSSGATDALISAVESGQFSISSLKVIIQVILNNDESVTTIEGIFDDLQPLLSRDGLERRNILEITWPARQASANARLAIAQERVLELTILINSVSSSATETGLRGYQGLAATLRAILTIVQRFVNEAESLNAANEIILTNAAANGFIVTQIELSSWWSNVIKISNLLGRAEGTTVAVVNAFNSGQLSVSSVTLIIQTLLQIDETELSFEQLFETFKTLYVVDLNVRQTSLAAILPWRITYSEKLVTISEQRLIALTNLVNSIVAQYSNRPAVVTIVKNILTLIISYNTEISSRLLANKNIVAWIDSMNYDVAIDDLVSYNENELIIWKIFGQISGVTEALSVAYTSGQFSISSLEVIIQTFLSYEKTETFIESIYEEMSSLASYVVGSSLESTLQYILKNFLGESVQYTGSINEAIALRSLLTSISSSLQVSSNTQIQSIDEVVALQTILAVILPARQAQLESYFLLIRVRLEKLIVLVNDYTKQAEETVTHRAIVQLLNTIVSTISNQLSQVEIRVTENRDFITTIARRKFLTTYQQLQPVFNNLQFSFRAIGHSEGALVAVTEAYNSGQLTITQITTIIRTILQPGTVESSIEAIYEELQSLTIVQDITSRSQLVATLVPWRLATIEKLILVFKQQTVQFQILANDIIQRATDTSIRTLMNSILSFVITLRDEADSLFLSVRTAFDVLVKNNFDAASSQQLNSLFSRIQRLQLILGRIDGAMQAVAVAYYDGSFSVSVVQTIINTLITIDTSISEIDIIYDDLEILSSSVVGSNLQSTLNSILRTLSSRKSSIVSTGSTSSSLSQTFANFGSAKDAIALRSLLGVVKNAFSSEISNLAVTSINDVIALQTVLALLLPARQATLEKFVIVHQTRYEEMTYLIDDLIVQMSESPLPSHNSIVALLRGIVSMVKYFLKEAQFRASANREVLQFAISRRFLVTTQEYEPFIKNLMIGFESLGRSAGGVDAIITAINSGELSIHTLVLIIQNILQYDQSSNEIGAIFDDLQPLLSINHLNRVNVLETIMPTIQATLERQLMTREERITEFTILINDYVSQAGELGAATYNSVTSLLTSILKIVTRNVNKESEIISITANLLKSQSLINFDVSDQDLQLFDSKVREFYRLLALTDGTIEAVVNAYNSNQLSITTISVIIKQLLQLEESTASTEGIFSQVESLYALNTVSRQSALSVVIPWRIAFIEKYLQVTEIRITQLNVLIQDIILKSDSVAMKNSMQSILNLITSLYAGASARFIANKNIVVWITERNFDVDMNDFAAFNQNDIFIMKSLGNIAGAIEALVVAYNSGQLTVRTVTLVLESFFSVDQSLIAIESLYDQLSDLTSISLGANIAATLQSLVNNFVGDSVTYSGSINEVTAFRALLKTISTNYNSVTSITDAIALQTVLAVVLPARQALIDRLIILYQQRIDDFQVLTTDIIMKYSQSSISKQAITIVIQRLVTSINMWYSDAKMRANDNRQIITSAARRMFLISTAEAYSFIENTKIIQSDLGQVAGIIETVSNSYTSGQFSVDNSIEIINQFLQYDSGVSSIAVIYEELSSLISIQSSNKQQILASILPFRLANVELHLSIHQYRARQLTALIENIIKTSNQNIIRQLLHSILNYELSLVNEATSKVFVIKEIGAVIAANNYVISDQQLRELSNIIKSVSMNFGRALGITEAIATSYAQGEFSVQSTINILNSFIQTDNTQVQVESLFDSFESLVVARPNYLQQILSTILPSLGSTTDVSFGTLESAEALRSAVSSIKQSVSTTAVTSLDDVVAFQVILALALPAEQSFLDSRLAAESKRIEQVYTIISTIIQDQTDITLESYTQLTSQLREVYALIVYLFGQSQTYSQASRDFITIAISRNFLLSGAELIKFSDDLKIAIVTIGKVSGAIDAILSSYGSGDLAITTSTLTTIITQLRNTYTMQAWTENFVTVTQTIQKFQILITTYYQNRLFSVLQQISQLLIQSPDIFIPEDIRIELARLGLLPDSVITEQILLLQLIEQYKESQSSTILSQIIPLLMIYTDTKVPLVLVIALIQQGVLIRSESYYILVIEQYLDYSDNAIILISHLISAYPSIPLTLPILEHLIRVKYVSIVVLEQLVRIWLDTQSPVALRLILEIYQRFPTYTLPIGILDQIYQQTSISTSTTESTTTLLTRITDSSEITRSYTYESLLIQLIAQFQQFPTEALLLEIDELYRLVPDFSMPVVILEQITLLRLVSETVLLPTPTITILERILTMSSQYPIITIPSSLQEQINLIVWIRSLTPSFDILRSILPVSRLYPHISIPFAIQEQLILLQLIEYSSTITLEIIERIIILSETYTHLTLPTNILEQVTLVKLLKSSLTVETLTVVTTLSSTYPNIILPKPIREQINLLQMIQLTTLTEIQITQIISLSNIYPNIPLPNNIQDVIYMTHLIEDIVISRYASETIFRKIVSLTQVYSFVTLPTPVQDIIRLYQLIDVVKTSSYTVDNLIQINSLSQLYPKIPIPLSILQLIYTNVQTTVSTSTTSSTSSSSSSQSVTITTDIFNVPAYIHPADLSAEEELLKTIQETLLSPTVALIHKIIVLRDLAPSVAIPNIILQQITLVQQITSVSSSVTIDESQLYDISVISPSFPHIPVPNSIRQQITLLQLITEASSSSTSSVVIIIRQIYQLSILYPRFAIPVRIREMMTLVQLIDEVVLQPAPSSFLVDEIATISSSYPFIQLPVRIQEQIALQRLLIQATQSSSYDLLLEISRLSRIYTHVLLPSIIQQQISFVILLQEVSSLTNPTVDTLKQIYSLSSLYSFINVPSTIQQQISFILLIERAVQSTSPSYALISQIVELSARYSHIEVPAYLLKQFSLYQLIEQSVGSTTISITILQQIATLSQAFPFIAIPESIAEQIILMQLINEMNTSPSIIIIEEIIRISSRYSNFILPDALVQQITLKRLIAEVSLMTAPSVSVLEQIIVLSQPYPYITIPIHIQQQITLIQLLKTASTETSDIYSLLPQIVELSIRFPHIPINSNLTQLIILYNLIQQVLLTPSPLPDTLLKISQLYQTYPNYPVPASILQLIQNLSTSSSTSVSTSVQSSTTVISSVTSDVAVLTKSAAPAPVVSTEGISAITIILRQLIAQAIQGSPSVVLLQEIAVLAPQDPTTLIPTSIQEQLVLLQFIEEASASLSPTPHLLHQIATLASNHPHIPIPSITQQQITLVKLIEEISISVTPTMASIVKISSLSRLFPYLPVPPHIQQQIILVQLVDEVMATSSPSLSIIRQIAQLSSVFPNIDIPSRIREQLTLIDLITQVTLSYSSVTTSVVQQISTLSASHPYIPIPDSITEVMRLVTLLQITPLNLAQIQEIYVLSQSFVNVLLPQAVQEQITLFQLINEVSITSSPSFLALNRILELSLLYPNIVLPNQIQDQILLLQSINTISSTLSFEETHITTITQLSAKYPFITIPEIINQYILLRRLTADPTPSIEVLQQITVIITAYPALPVDPNIKDQILLVQLIGEFSRATSPTMAVIYQIISLSTSYPHISLPDPLQQVIQLVKLIQQVITVVNVDDPVLPLIAQLSPLYPYVPLPTIIQERIDLYNLINQASASATILPDVIRQIDAISMELPGVSLPAAIIDQRQKLAQRTVLLDLVSNVELSSEVDPSVLLQIEQLTPYFPDIVLPPVVQDRIFVHIQETIMQELISEALATPNSISILQQIEQMSSSIPEFVIPDAVMSQIINMQQSSLLQQLIDEVLSAQFINENTLHHIYQISQTLPDYSLPLFVQQALTLQSLIENIVHAPASAIFDPNDLLQIGELSASVPTYAIPFQIQKLLNLANLVTQVQDPQFPTDNLDPLLQLAELSQAYPNFAIPAPVLQRITEAKNTIQLQELIKKAQNSAKVDITVIQQISKLSPGLPNVPLPLPIQQQVTLVNLIQKAQTSPADPSIVKQLSELSKLHPGVPLPANVRQLIAPSAAPTMSKNPPSRASEAQLRQYLSMYDRMPSPSILRQIANILPSVQDPSIPEKVMIALVQQGLVPADSFPQIQLQQLIQQYQTSPSPSLIQQIAQISSGLPAVTLPANIQQSVSLYRAESTFNDLNTLASSSLISNTAFDSSFVASRLDSLDRQIQLGDSYLELARGVVKQLMENVRETGHPMHRATFSAFGEVLDLIQNQINTARNDLVAYRQLQATGGVGDITAVSLRVQDALGKAEGARQALLKEAKEVSSQVIASSDREISLAQQTKDQMSVVFNDLVAHTNTFTKRSAPVI